MRPTEDEEKLCYRYLYINYLIEVLENDFKGVNLLPFKIKEPYEHLIDQTLMTLRLDLKQIKQEFRKSDMKVVGPKQVNVDFVEYQFFIRGHKDIKRIFTYHMRNQATKLLEEYFFNLKGGK